MATEQGSGPPNHENVNVYGDSIYVRYKEGGAPKPAGRSPEDTELSDLNKTMSHIGEKPTWLGDAIKELAKEIANHLNQDSAGGRGGDGGGENRPNIGAFSTATSTRQQSETMAGRAIEDLAEETIKLRKTFDSTIKLLVDFGDFKFRALELSFQMISETLSGLRQELIKFTAEVVSGRYAINHFTELFETTLEAASIGIGSFTDMLENAVKMGPSYVDTLEAIKQNVEAGGNAFGYANKSMTEFGKALAMQRDALERLVPDVDARLDFKAQNQVLLDIYNTMVRSGVDASIDDERVAQLAAWQISYLKDIAKATGKSLAELVKLNEKPVSIEDAIALGQASGGLSDEEAVRALAAYNEMMAQGNTSGAQDLATFIKNLATGGVTGFDSARHADRSFEAAKNIFDQGIRGGGDLRKAIYESSKMRLQTQQSFGGFAQIDGSMLDRPGSAADANKTIKLLEAIKKNTGSQAEELNTWPERMFRSFQEWMSNNAWIKDVIALASGGIGAAVILAATIKNTIATMANTGALGALTGAVTQANAGAAAAIGGTAAKGGILGGIFKFVAGLVLMQTAIEGIMHFLTPENMTRFGEGVKGVIANLIASFAPLLAAGFAGLLAIFLGAPATLALVAAAGGAMLYKMFDEWYDGGLTEGVGKFTAWVVDQIYYMFEYLYEKITDWGIVDAAERVGEGISSVWDDLMDVMWRDSPIVAEELNKTRKFLLKTDDKFNPGGRSDEQIMEELKKGNEQSRELLKQINDVMRSIDSKTDRRPPMHRSA